MKRILFVLGVLALVAVNMPVAVMAYRLWLEMPIH